MHKSQRLRRTLPNRWMALVGGWLVCLCVVGGASRAGEVGQLITRFAGWAVFIVTILSARRFAWRETLPVVGLVGAMVVLVALQSVPLPPGLWMGLPGRGFFAGAATAIGEAQPWRPLSVSPDATINALSSLIVPVTTLALMVAAPADSRGWTASLLLVVILASAALALLQLSGAGIDNPFINDVPGMVSGSFANRNHFALFAAIGCLITPAWALRGERLMRWKLPVGVGIVVLLGLLILAAGSRTGLLLGALAIVIGMAAVRREAFREFSRMPRWVNVAVVGAIVALGAAAVIASIAFGRATSIERLLALDSMGEIRSQARPIVVDLIGTYFPAGAGAGTFDAVFRMVEPFALLKRSYFNHAHNDFLEVTVEGGVAALILVGCALVWWLRASVAAWRDPHPAEGPFARIGSGIIFLILLASIWDYPARTPMIMAVLGIAAVWLAFRPASDEQVSARGDKSATVPRERPFRITSGSEQAANKRCFRPFMVANKRKMLEGLTLGASRWPPRLRVAALYQADNGPYRAPAPKRSWNRLTQCELFYLFFSWFLVWRAAPGTCRCSRLRGLPSSMARSPCPRLPATI